MYSTLDSFRKNRIGKRIYHGFGAKIKIENSQLFWNNLLLSLPNTKILESRILMWQKRFYIRSISRLVCICNLQHWWKFWTGVSYDCETSELEWKEWVTEICTKNWDAQKPTPGQNPSHHLSGGLDDIAELCRPSKVKEETIPKSLFGISTIWSSLGSWTSVCSSIPSFLTSYVPIWHTWDRKSVV